MPEQDWSHVTQDLLDALPKAWTRGILYLLAVSAAVVVPWSMFTNVEETGSARGRLEPQSQVLQLDAPVSGTVTAVKVKEGETVQVGQVLMELDSDVLRAERQQAEAKLNGALDRLTQLALVKNQLELTTRTQELQNQAQAAAQLAQVEQNQQELDFNETAYQLAQELLDKDRHTAERLQTAQESGVVPLLQVEEAERSLIQSQQRLEQTHSDIQKSQVEIERQKSTYEGLLRQGELAILESKKQIEELQTQITDTKAEVTQTRQQIHSLEFQLRQRVLHAPIDGVLFELLAEGVGDVVNPGDLVAEIAPQGTPLILKAHISSQESGFLKVGMPVKVKFDAYPFQDYGVVSGRLNWISPSSKVVKSEQGQMEVFDLKIALDRLYIDTPNGRVALTPGQTATAELIIRQRRVIDFILDPFKKLQEGGLEL
ncbi:HlyD family efflux transporter periplasmic adaptor subunit [Oculatella sp. LEGE 06141]|nr:HlyD family efflux transporter periplasmic adaptor subunit [Oculatella sp. LEGE 06141]